MGQTPARTANVQLKVSRRDRRPSGKSPPLGGFGGEVKRSEQNRCTGTRPVCDANRYAKARKQSARNSGKLSRTVSQIVRKSTLSGSEDTQPVPIDLALHPGVARRFYDQIDFRIEHL